MSESDSIPILLKRRRRMRSIIAGVAASLLALSVLDHTKLFGYAGNLQRRFDRQRATVTDVLSGDTLKICLVGEADETTVHLLGVAAPDHPTDYWADRGKIYLSARLLRQSVTLRLDSIGWRDAHGDVQAYVYLTDSDDLNLDIIHDGQAYADRRISYAMHAPFEAAENEARVKKRGLWRTATTQDMPAWRQAWMKERGF